MTRGWAVVQNDCIDIKTVHDSRRGAIVNWLWLHGMAITQATTDEQIELMWERYAPAETVRVAEVSVSLAGMH